MGDADLEHRAYDDLITCLDPLYQIITDAHASEDQKRDSMIPFFWLTSQTTPVTRGGSAHARINIEYLSTQAGIALPHVKKGYDLWAEAATTPLSKFTNSFKTGELFDPRLTNAEILQWQEKQLRFRLRGGFSSL